MLVEWFAVLLIAQYAVAYPSSGSERSGEFYGRPDLEDLCETNPYAVSMGSPYAGSSGDQQYAAVFDSDDSDIEPSLVGTPRYPYNLNEVSVKHRCNSMDTRVDKNGKVLPVHDKVDGNLFYSVAFKDENPIKDMINDIKEDLKEDDEDGFVELPDDVRNAPNLVYNPRGRRSSYVDYVIPAIERVGTISSTLKSARKSSMSSLRKWSGSSLFPKSRSGSSSRHPENSRSSENVFGNIDRKQHIYPEKFVAKAEVKRVPPTKEELKELGDFLEFLEQPKPIFQHLSNMNGVDLDKLKTSFQNDINAIAKSFMDEATNKLSPSGLSDTSRSGSVSSRRGSSQYAPHHPSPLNSVHGPIVTESSSSRRNSDSSPSGENLLTTLSSDFEKLTFEQKKEFLLANCESILFSLGPLTDSNESNRSRKSRTHSHHSERRPSRVEPVPEVEENEDEGKPLVSAEHKKEDSVHVDSKVEEAQIEESEKEVTHHIEEEEEEDDNGDVLSVSTQEDQFASCIEGPGYDVLSNLSNDDEILSDVEEAANENGDASSVFLGMPGAFPFTADNTKMGSSEATIVEDSVHADVHAAEIDEDGEVDDEEHFDGLISGNNGESGHESSYSKEQGQEQDRRPLSRTGSSQSLVGMRNAAVSPRVMDVITGRIRYQSAPLPQTPP